MGLAVRDRARLLPCLVCGVDSGPIRLFIFGFIGALVLGSLCLFAWAYASGRILGDDGAANRLALDAEERDRLLERETKEK